MQIVDARNPLLFRHSDLEAYVREARPAGKQNVLLLNKADLLSPRQRRCWADYFKREGVLALFWSAATAEDDDAVSATTSHPDVPSSSNVTADTASKDGSRSNEDANDDSDEWSDADSEDESEEESEKVGASSVAQGAANPPEDEKEDDDEVTDPIPLLSTPMLTAALHELAREYGRPITVGMVGYPNVGKSSTINRLLGRKKVPVSATPGRTRHLQTLPLSSSVRYFAIGA